MIFFKFFTYGFLIFLLKTFQIECEIADNDVYFIEHSIDSFEFKEIGYLNLRLLRQNQNAAQVQTLNSEDELQNEPKYTTNAQYSTQIDLNKFDQETREQIESKKFSNSSMYRLRLCKKQPSNKCFASSFTYLKNVIESGWILNLTVHSGASNRVNSISVRTSPLTTPLKREPDHLTIFVNVQSIKQGQQPDTETYLEKLRIEREHKEKGAQTENQSFLSKYWIYIVPFVIIMFLMSIVNPEAAAAGSR